MALINNNVFLKIAKSILKALAGDSKTVVRGRKQKVCLLK
jgi:hypothetical protein